jgi:hypothetical protein
MMTIYRAKTIRVQIRFKTFASHAIAQTYFSIIENYRVLDKYGPISKHNHKRPQFIK